MPIIASSGWKTAATWERIDWKDIKDRVDLARVVTAILGPAAKRQGRYLLWGCPFHHDHDPSFQVDTRRGTWKCWPCDLGGDAPALVMQLNGVTFPEAVRIVAELSGIVAAERRPASPRPRPPRPAPALAASKPASPPPERSSGLPLDEASSLVTEAAGRLWTPEGTEALAYLHGRGLTDETIRAARLGVVKSVSIPTREGDRCYRACGVVVPWLDGNCLCLVKLRQPEGSKGPKYVEAYRDRPTIYPGTDAIEPGRPLVIVEGELDALLLGQELRDLAAVVTLGSASSRPDPATLVDLMPAAPWFLALDGDEAGDKAAATWPARAVRVRPPEGLKDWTELGQSGSGRIRYHWGRMLPMSLSWEALAVQRWGPARNDYDDSAREIQTETRIDLTAD
jgi:DNA primase